MEEKTRTKEADRLRVIAQEYFAHSGLHVRKQLFEIADAYDDQNEEIARLKAALMAKIAVQALKGGSLKS